MNQNKIGQWHKVIDVSIPFFNGTCLWKEISKLILDN